MVWQAGGKMNNSLVLNIGESDYSCGSRSCYFTTNYGKWNKGKDIINRI